MRDSRYGLRAVRVGEATHPGPSVVPTTILDALELDLSEGDDEWHQPPVRRCRPLRVFNSQVTVLDSVDLTANDSDMSTQKICRFQSQKAIQCLFPAATD